MAKRKLNIAIDGPAGAGKSTVAHRLAHVLGYDYIDSGAIYRAIALHGLAREIDLNNEEQIKRLINEMVLEYPVVKDGITYILLNGENVADAIRDGKVNDVVARVAKWPQVRDKVFQILRASAADKGVVMDGRDIGTVVLPHADVKIFLTASAEERARRRYEEMLAQSEGKIEIDFDAVLAAIVERDFRDESRDVAPLRRADDAVLVDTTDLTVDDVVQKLLALVGKQGASGALLDR